ncbi:outer membrane beta-barrel protein [Salinivibrio sp. ES.052]|uniref:outer membrane beta-barrel protein n=1 Tax=Salinivibrio sp. ES.052 TaxID=1882823 RepID=UPI000929C368|nr:outer membrane beta-barrel protein [Salinivibrio sp. ES.052]SIN81099.1 outer membrane insertion C-terminal signal [Salinivibrio sp. ES.052]
MKKLAPLALLILAPAAYASSYMGMEFGAGSADVSGLDSSEFKSDLEDRGTVKLYGGKYITDSVRTYGYWQSGASSKSTIKAADEELSLENTDYQFGMGLDYVHEFTDNLYGIAGGTLGYQRSKLEIKDKDAQGTDTYNLRDSGLASNVNLGLGYRFDSGIALEGGHKYGLTKQKYAEGISFKNPSVFYLDVNYKF